MDETFSNLLKVIEERDTAINELSNRLEGYYTVTRHLLDKIIQIWSEIKCQVLLVMLIHMKRKLVNKLVN